MSNQDNFAGGFFLGALVGGVVGGVLGAALTSARLNEAALPEETKRKKREIKPSSEKSIEQARRGLEDKIAQLHDAIDDVRQQLSTVNSNGLEDSYERSYVQDTQMLE